ncbi:MAG: hypothetical protein JKX84_02595 [Flavobacteriales bacterium]|nr:hypothetical protein [Flavobacteriales bacterium]
MKNRRKWMMGICCVALFFVLPSLASRECELSKASCQKMPEAFISPPLARRERVQQRVDYGELKVSIAQRKTQLIAAYKNPKCSKDSVVRCAQKFLFSTITTKVFPAWYGTKWDYNGTTQEPRKGSIACGYFVTTTLRDMGFDIPRVRWAQLPSETMICEMTESKYIKRYRFADINHIENEILKWGNGLYVVGTDSHVGFIVNTNGKCRFVHSDYFNPTGGVISEKLNSDNPLRFSKYRIIGKILMEEMVVEWLTE